MANLMTNDAELKLINYNNMKSESTPRGG